MKKYISALGIVLSLFVCFPAKAEVPAGTFFFQDGKGYDLSGTQTYFCFADNSCYDLQGLFSFVRDAQTQITNLQNKVDNLQNTVNQLQTPVVGGDAQASSTPVVDNPIQPARYFFDIWSGDATSNDAGVPLVVIGKLKSGVSATLEITDTSYTDINDKAGRWVSNPSSLIGKTYSLVGSSFHLVDIVISDTTTKHIASYLYIIHLSDGIHTGEMSGAFSY